MLIINGQVVLKDKVVTGAIAVEDGNITAILLNDEEIAEWKEGINDQSILTVIDAKQRFVLPGLIDIHCDAIEKEVQPRPNTLFPLEMALVEFERKLPLHGITTMYHSLSLGVGLSLRGDHLLTKMIELIHHYNRKRAIIRNRVHLRFEVSHHAGVPILKRFLDEGKIHYLSYMDHSPGQGQYRETGSFEKYVMKNQGVSLKEVQGIVEGLLKRQQEIDWDQLKRLGNFAVERGIPVASHDDDSPAKVDQLKSYGISVCEFPINLDTAKYATELGYSVCVGAPNVVRGISHDNNLNATDAIQAGVATILCSDYHPSSLLGAIFKLVDEGIADLPVAVRMATLHPAQALHIDNSFGSIEIGKAADIIIIDRYEGLPWVTDTIVNGVHVLAASVRY
ncbi:alpha-D-ribose 1-methylphosphonate 5-triphosphate diphosphatase [Paenibacillus sp. L3-i20]|uniref:alpha-D-ribose 1-methylphosphonate 5-triphosphate diphosphatase n=1 Tax=Paenibacillus sp. L3-i20 TaxID=2905833 RepID=UPI0020827B2C|nr:alpha-D-ribose 1-methylphosphonate 5-triphosphate diphosphatase [Paenibacillus sp. L3-i20]GKU76071.1 alpha-D-ribose 1-methylphosphonate 5-triphosphate diphosphatase [Paenibacillus sp. L3-i20]